MQGFFLSSSCGSTKKNKDIQPRDTLANLHKYNVISHLGNPPGRVVRMFMTKTLFVYHDSCNTYIEIMKRQFYSCLLHISRTAKLFKKMPPLFFISRSSSLSLFFVLSFAGLSPTFSFSLSFSISIFQILDVTINLSLIL